MSNKEYFVTLVVQDFKNAHLQLTGKYNLKFNSALREKRSH